MHKVKLETPEVKLDHLNFLTFHFIYNQWVQHTRYLSSLVISHQ